MATIFSPQTGGIFNPKTMKEILEAIMLFPMQFTALAATVIASFAALSSGFRRETLAASWYRQFSELVAAGVLITVLASII